MMELRTWCVASVNTVFEHKEKLNDKEDKDLRNEMELDKKDKKRR
jgi:hypothetical protein